MDCPGGQTWGSPRLPTFIDRIACTRLLGHLQLKRLEQQTRLFLLLRPLTKGRLELWVVWKPDQPGLKKPPPTPGWELHPNPRRRRGGDRKEERQKEQEKSEQQSGGREEGRRGARGTTHRKAIRQQGPLSVVTTANAKKLIFRELRWVNYKWGGQGPDSLNTGSIAAWGLKPLAYNFQFSSR